MANAAMIHIAQVLGVKVVCTSATAIHSTRMGQAICVRNR